MDSHQDNESADRRTSTGSDFGSGGGEGSDEDHIRVICRVRPCTHNIVGALGPRTCVSVDEDGTTVILRAGSGPKLFTFDHSVGPNGTQEMLFQMAGKPATRACMQGYNGTVFCYGQTGSGKTYTMFGPNVDACDSDDDDDDQRGLVPRVLEYLFSHVAREERRNAGAVKFLCRCSFYEIFNERVFDLLDSGCSLGGLQTREDMKKGVYVEGLTEEAVDSPHQAHQILTRGYRNRHVGETAMNRESSRSHAVFTVTLESREVDTRDGITRSRCASFNLVDLAGSERQNASQATGERLKEASSINKSLSALGNVINALVSGKTRYVPYRDSRLTFLLRDSLGGNAKTFLVAALSPNDENFAESLSTLKFAQRAKMIKNKAIVNENTTGTVDALQKQVRQLRQELLSAKAVISASGSITVPVGQMMIEGQGGRSDAAQAAIKSTAESKRTQMLLKEALDRSLRLEQARGLAEKMAANVQATVDRLEQNVLHEKMVRKLKESQIQRHLKKQIQAAHSTTDAPSPTKDEELRQEIELLRKELDLVPLETVKWKTAAENAQKQLDALVDEKGLGMWVEAKEEAFVSSLEKELKAVLEDKNALEERLSEVEEELKMRPARGHKPRLSDGGMMRLKEAEQRCTAMEGELTAAKKIAQESEALLAETRAHAAQAVSAQSQLIVKLTLTERRLENVENENKTLKADRDANMAALKDRIEHLQAQHQEHAARQDLEERLAAACKDNTILLQRLRETAEDADKAAERQRKAEVQGQALTEELQQLRLQMQALKAELVHSKEAAVKQAQDFESKEVSFKKQIEGIKAEAKVQEARHAQKVTELKTALVEATGRVQALRCEKDEANFQLANLQEDHDTLNELLEFMQGKIAELEKGLSESQASVQNIQKEQARTESAMEDLNAQITDLEGQLDKVGGDAAEERKVLRDMERANQELLEERARLLESLDSSKADLHEAEKRHAKAIKEAVEHEKRQGQVVSDLTDQISRLCSELAEIVAKEQEARVEAEGLSQEREDLVQRAEDAEETQAELIEETKSYLGEIATLKAQVTGLEKEHEAKELRHQESLQKAQSETNHNLQQIAALQRELDALKESLQEKEKGDEARALLEVEEAKLQVKEAEKRLQKAEWRHTQEVAGLQQSLADAEARGAKAARLQASLSTNESQCESLKTQTEELQSALAGATSQLEAANERCQALAKQVGERLTEEKDYEAWCEEKARWEGEVERARQMEKESFDRFEMAEQQRVKIAKEVETLEHEVNDLKAANVRLIGHANSRQKIQLHHKLKEELSGLSKKCKALEEENYHLKVHGKSRVEGKVALGEVTNLIAFYNGGKKGFNSSSSNGETEKQQPIRTVPTPGRVTRSRQTHV